jgi:MHS family proline/betaine transporter-like MFS transporter
MRQLLRNERRAVLCVALASTGTLNAYLIVTIYLNIHMTATLGYPTSSALWVFAGLGLFIAATLPIAGALSDRFGRRKVLTAGLVGYAVLVFPTLRLMGLGSFPLAVLGLFILALPVPVVQAASYPLFAEQFPTQVRLSGLSLGFNIGTVAGAGLAAYLAAWLSVATGSPFAPAALIIAAVALTLLAMPLMRAPVDTPPDRG